MDYVVSSGTLPDVTLRSGDTMEVFSSGTAVSTTVEAGSLQTVYGGGVVIDGVLSGGALNVSAGGSATDTTADSGFIRVYNGGVSTGTQLSSAGVGYVFSGGASYSATVTAGASLEIYAPTGDLGGVVSATTVDNATLTVSGGTAYNTTVSSSDVNVFNGVTSGTALYGSSVELLSPQGAAVSTTINSGAEVYNETYYNNISGGVYELLDTVINSGGTNSMIESNVTSTTINGGVQELNQCTTADTVVESGGLQDVFGGTTTSTTVVNGGTQIAGGLVYDTTVEHGGTLDGGIDSMIFNALVSSGGTEILGEYSNASGTILKPGADATVFSGGTDNESTIGFGAAETIAHSGFADSAHVTAGGLLAVENGGSAFATSFGAGGFLVVAPGGKVSGTIGDPTVVNKGVVVQSPTAGPKAYATSVVDVKIAATGSAFVLPSGKTVSASDKGLMTVYSGGTAIHTTVLGALTVLSGGVESGGLIGSGGSETVSGTTTYNDVIGSGGFEKLLDIETPTSSFLGGASGATIAGGTLDVTYRTKLIGTVTFTGSGGVLEDGNTVVPTNVISGFAAGDEIALPAAITYSVGATVSVKTAGVVTIHSDNHSYNLNIAGASVGETDFAFGPGSILTKTAAAATMSFLRSPEPATNMGATASVSSRGHVVIHDGSTTEKLNIAGTTLGEPLVFGPGSYLTVGTAAMAFMAPETAAAVHENWFGGSVMVETPMAVPLFVSSAVHFGAVPDLVETVHKGGAQGFVVLPRE